MQNSIWKILAALGVVGLGTFVVLQVQHRLPSFKKQANTVERAAADSANAALPPDAAPITPEQFAASKASPDTFFSVNDDGTATSASTPKDANPFDLGEPPQETDSGNSSADADAKTTFLFEATGAENAVMAASYQSDNAPESENTAATGAEPTFPSLDSDNSVPIPPADAAGSNPDAPILKFFSPDEDSAGSTEPPPDNTSDGDVPAPIDLPEPKTPPADSNPPEDSNPPGEGDVPGAREIPGDRNPATNSDPPEETSAIPEPPGDDVPALVVPEPVPDVTSPTPADPFPPAVNPSPTLPKRTTTPPAPVTPKSPFREPVSEPAQPVAPRINRGPSVAPSSPTEPISPPKTAVPAPKPAVPTTPDSPDKVDRPGRSTAPPKSVDRAFEPDAPTPVAPAPGNSALERTFVPDKPQNSPAPINRLTPRINPPTTGKTDPPATGRTMPSTTGTIGPGTRAAEPEPFAIDAESTSGPDAQGASRPSGDEDRRATPAAEPEPFDIDTPEAETRPAGGRPLPPLNDGPELQKRDRDLRPDGSSGSPASDAPDSSRRISEVMRPQLTVRKQAPESATVGVAHEYRIVVSNEGDSPAYDVVVEDELSNAAEFISSRPFAEFDKSTGILAWNIPELAPRETKEIAIRIKPTGEGTLDGMATVRFKAQVRSATVIRSPRLQLELQGPAEVKVGDEVSLQFRLVNRGTGDASNVVLRSVLPPGLRHPEGGDLEYELDLLRAGEAQDVDLVLIAAEPGKQIRVSAELSADGMAPASARTDLAIIGSQLSIERLGPDKRYVGRPARFQNVITNDTSFEAVGAIVEERVPEGMEVANVSSGGDYNASSRIIRWELPRIAPGKQVVLDSELVAETTGRMESVVEVIESAGFRSRAAQNTVVMVEGLHNVTADISRLDKPVAIGERFGFTVTIDNRGTAVARNVRILLQVPKEIEVVAAGTREIPGELLQGNVVRYETVVSIKPNEKRKFQVTLQGQQAIRNAVVQAQLKYDEMDKPLIVSESVTVFDDQF
jgi:uncharacterized repeat protein (TIGR01451 family)